MERIWKKLKLLKVKLKQLHTHAYPKVEAQTQLARQKLTEIQMQLRDNYDDAELFGKDKEMKH
ncbi:hypothetical protein KY285_026165 [Solanum tuberosum]|nr:hypothetical protein KY285_026165 [Solanum tuberosum]